MVHPPRPIKKRPPRKTRSSIKKATVLQKKKTSSKRTPFIIAAAVVLAIVIIAGSIFYFVAVMPNQRVFFTVGTENIKTGYFLKRVAVTGDADTTVQQLTTEFIIEQTAPQYGIAPVTPADIDTYMRTAAQGTNDTISDADFTKWLKEQLANTGLTEKEYREIIGREILGQRIAEIIGAGVQSVVPQVHLLAIVTGTNDAALTAKARIDGGEAFSDVAKAVSTSPTAATDGGDIGWLPPELLSSQLSSTVDALDIGKCSDPVPYASQDSTTGATTTNYFLLMITEKSAAMQVTDDQLTMLKNKAMSDWVSAQASTTQVIIHGRSGNTSLLDDETKAWVNYQVQKLIKKRPSTTSTAPVTSPTTEATTTPATEPTTTPTTTP